MARFLFVSAPLSGHLDWGGYLSTAVALAARGHEVLWASGAAVAPHLHQAGIAHHILAETGWRWPPPPPLPATDPRTGAELQRLRQLRALDQWLDEERVAAATAELAAVARAYQPDLIVGEMFVAAAALVAEMVEAPFAVAGWPASHPAHPAAEDDMARLARDRLARLLSRFRLQGVHWTDEGPPALRSARLHVTYWSPTWFAGVSLGEQTRHVGGLRPAAATPLPDLRGALPDPEEAPWVLVTLGTSFNDDPNFFMAAAHAVDQMGGRALVVLGRPLAAEVLAPLRGRLPASARPLPHIDYGRIIPHVAAAIHHGGAGTTHALVRHAVPQIVVPHAADQGRQALGVQRSGVGLHLPAQSVTVPSLVAALAATLPDLSEFRARAQALQAEFHALGGAPAAAELLVQSTNQPAIR